MENIWEVVMEALELKGCTAVERISENEIAFVSPGGQEVVLTLDFV